MHFGGTDDQLTGSGAILKPIANVVHNRRALIATSAAVFAVRGLSYAMMEAGRVPFRDTGSAVGIVSVVGYTPHVFMGPLMGILLDGWPGELGYQMVFAILTLPATVGLMASSLFWRIVRRPT